MIEMQLSLRVLGDSDGRRKLLLIIGAVSIANPFEVNDLEYSLFS